VSSFAIEKLIGLLRCDEIVQSDWVRRGASADVANFTAFNVTDDGLVLTFPPYQVASWANGPQEVTVPWSRLRDVLNPRFVL
jgi:hypothetical protein